jgi:hypothetical protein
MNKLYNAILLTRNEYNALQVRFCNDLKSRKIRLVRDKYTIVTEYEHTERIDKSYLCELLLANSKFNDDEEYDIVNDTKNKYANKYKLIERRNNLTNTTTQDILNAVNM